MSTFKDLLSLKNPKVLKIMNIFWYISIVFNIISIALLTIFSKYYITIDLFFISKEIATTSLITLSFSYICSLMFENYFLKM